MTRRHAILLDALGTLVRLEPPWPRLRELLAARHGIDVSLADAERALRAEMDYYRAHCIAAADEPALRELREQCAAIVAAQLGVAVPIETLLDALRFEPYPEVPAALERLRGAGLRLIVVSNWDISLHDVLRGCGLRPLLDGVVTSAEVGRAKPDPAPFEAALELAGGVPPDRALHAGDSVVEDLGGARAAGIDALLVWREGAPPAGLGAPVIRTLAELRP